MATPKNEKGGNLEFRHKIWQPGFYDYNIHTESKFWQKIDYIHNNPIKHQITNDLSNYKYSSWKNYELEDNSIFRIDYSIY